MVFCNLIMSISKNEEIYCHNPYFNRWFSAIWIIKKRKFIPQSHNPYFNRWFSAIIAYVNDIDGRKVTILILIDGFLQ